ncbi:MAG: toll/interleukin-1 receptor domain-containing protein [Paracraurococcus sp.]
MAKLSIFLSHSSKDKPFVRRLNKDLKSHGFTTWIDEDNIPFGGSIAKGIQSGLDTCDVLLVFLSEHSTASKWVATEWQSRFFREITDKHIQVVPVLIQKCVIPTFLADKRYIDFQEEGEYERNLSETLAYLNRLSLERYGEPVPVIRREQRILSHVQEILDDLVPEKLAMPLNRRMPIIDTLKKIPRSGKRVRLVDFKPTLKPRSVYDHILSLAHIADCLLPHIETRLKASELGDLSLCIAYHELNEMVLGDIPSYTSLTNEKRNMIRVYAEERVRSVSPASGRRSPTASSGSS